MKGDEVFAVSLRFVQLGLAIASVAIGGRVLSKVSYDIIIVVPLTAGVVSAIFLITTVAFDKLYNTWVSTLFEFLLLGTWVTSATFNFINYYGSDYYYYDYYDTAYTEAVVLSAAIISSLSCFFLLVTLTLRFIYSTGGSTPLTRGAIYSFPYIYQTGWVYFPHPIKVYQYDPNHRYPQQAFPPASSYSKTMRQPYPPISQQPYPPNSQQPYPPNSQQPYPPSSQQPYPPNSQQPYHATQVPYPQNQQPPPNQEQTTTAAEDSEQQLPKEEEISLSNQSSPVQQILVRRESAASRTYPLDSSLPSANVA